MQRFTRSLLQSCAFVCAVLPASAAGRLFVLNSNTNLNELNPTTGALIASTPITGGIGFIGAFAYEASTNTMFVSSTGNDSLWTIDYTTGVATLVGPYNVGNPAMHGLAVDDTGQIFGYSSDLAMGAYFFSIDRTTGQATPISGAPNASFGSIEFVAATQSMYLADLVLDSLYTIDRITGATTLIGPFGVNSQVGIGLAYDPVFGMYASNNAAGPGLYTIDHVTGTATIIAPLAGNPVALTFVTDPTGTPSTSFCTGDAVGTTCLACGNNGAAGRGCANSSFASGARLAASGTASLANDTLVLTATDVTGPGLFFQANAVSGSPITFGDGMLCASSGIIRLGVVFPTLGSASYPGGLTPNPISVGGAPIAAGDIKHYQCWYRDAIVFCSGATFNLTQGVSLTWAP